MGANIVSGLAQASYALAGLNLPILFVNISVHSWLMAKDKSNGDFEAP
jgi:hypothetical protein